MLCLRPPLELRQYHAPHKAWKCVSLPMHPDSNPDNWIAGVNPAQLEYMESFLTCPRDPMENIIFGVDWDNHAFILHGYHKINNPDVGPHLWRHVRKVAHIPRLMSSQKITFVEVPAKEGSRPLTAELWVYDKDVIAGAVTKTTKTRVTH